MDIANDKQLIVYTHYTIVALPAIDSTIGWPNLYTLHNIVGYPQILIQKNKKVPTYLLRATCSEPYPRLIDNRSLNDVCRPINLHAPITE